jgi:hypothetical protein
MPMSVRLTPEEETLLEAAARQSGRSKSELVREGIHQLCSRLARAGRSAYELGEDLFGSGSLARAPRNPAKRATWERLVAKHRRVG